METAATPNVILAFLPLLSILSVWALAFLPIARRKGKPIALHIILMFIPFVNFFYLMYVVSATDIEVKKRLEALENNK